MTEKEAKEYLENKDKKSTVKLLYYPFSLGQTLKFEFVNKDGFTLCGGGRYDNLVQLPSTHQAPY